MSTRLTEYLAKIDAAGDVGLPAVVNQMLNEIRGMSQAEQKELLAAVRDEQSAVGQGAGARWNNCRTLLGIVLHATGVRTVESAEEHGIRKKISEELAALNGDLEAYRSLAWISSEEVLERRGGGNTSTSE